MPASPAPSPDSAFNPKVDLYITHAKPFAQPIEWLNQGKQRNWKYQSS